MILLADSGSTKSHWCLLSRSGHSREVFTSGMNPYQMSVAELGKVVSEELLPCLAADWWAGTITDVYFYGAGCTPQKVRDVESALSVCFKHANFHIESDMVGAAIALFGASEGIACILGTGSNSCHWSGQKICSQVPALGYILGDEGSGAVLGRALVADILKNQTDKALKEKFLTQYNTSEAEIIERVYRQPLPNRYLAGFAKFAKENIEHPDVHRLVYQHFNTFVCRVLKQYDEGLPIGFVGSVAYHFSDILESVLRDNGMSARTVVQSPMEGLIDYHKKILAEN